MKRIVILLFLLHSCFSLDLFSQSRQNPNIIVILADDMGTGDLSSYNETSQIHTSNIDKLAAEGMRFTKAHSPSSVCTPTRYSLLTGRYAWRTTLKEQVLWPWDPPLIEPSRLTLPEMLQNAGYFTAAVGKWHLGWNWPTKDGNSAKEKAGQNVDYQKPINGGPIDHGFDYYFGDDVPNFPPYTFIENDRVVKVPTVEKPDSMFGHSGLMVPNWKLEEVMPAITHKSVEIIDSVAKSGNVNPFMLYFSLTAPHTPIAPIDRFRGKSNAGGYGDYVVEVDWSVGKIMKALERNRLDENTLVIFTSDNGSPARDGTDMAGELNSVIRKYGHDPSDGFRGIKADIWEGGHRVPFIAKWPGKIPVGTESSEIINLVDIMATVAEITDYRLQDNMAEDSYDITPVLFGENYNIPLREATVYHSFSGNFAIQQDEWKLILWPGSGGWTSPVGQDSLKSLPKYQLYNMKKDPKELHNLTGDMPGKVTDLKNILSRYIREGRSTPGNPQSNAPVEKWPQVDYWMSE
ncbi:arylsulfatase [Halalkalibaculum sp. DA384]|uniref:sulfatase family protein n=1 Tax=Halalkalibaculum sp. DA384 TaxID=3373606 RepID=UPI003753F348